MVGNSDRVQIFTDGGADPNPGVGGWGAILIHVGGSERKEISGGADRTTNNRMELTAAIEALRTLRTACVVELFTDSTYLRQGITSWLRSWKASGWRRRDGTPVKNVDLWQQLDAAAALHEISWRWVRGHAGNRWNERADALASAEIESRRSVVRAESSSRTLRSAVEGDDCGAIFLRVTSSGGSGAWAALVRTADGERQLGGDSAAGSANRLELLAACEVLAALPAGRWLFMTPSAYLRNGAQQWMEQWKRSGWQTSGGGEVRNVDLWKRLDRLSHGQDLRWPEVDKSSHPEFEQLKRAAKQRQKRGAATGSGGR